MVWVGLDDNQPLGLSGSQAALPIWTAFMKRALAGRAEARPFDAPDGIVFADIDKDTGKLATPSCPRTMFTRRFSPAPQPNEHCDIHGGHVRAIFARFGSWLKRIIRPPES